MFIRTKVRVTRERTCHINATNVVRYDALLRRVTLLFYFLFI